MIKFLADENLSKTVVRSLRASGFEVVGIAEVLQRGASDQVIYQYAKSNELTLLTRDLDFANIHQFPLSEH